jgi:hypothetical protein
MSILGRTFLDHEPIKTVRTLIFTLVLQQHHIGVVHGLLETLGFKNIATQDQYIATGQCQIGKINV